MTASWIIVAILLVGRVALAQTATTAPRYVFEPHTRFTLDVRCHRSETETRGEGQAREVGTVTLRYLLRVIVLERRANGDHTLALTADSDLKLGPDGKRLEVGPIGSYEGLAITRMMGTCTLTPDGRLTSIELEAGRQMWHGQEPFTEPLSLVFPPLPTSSLRKSKPWRALSLSDEDVPPSESAKRTEFLSVDLSGAHVVDIWRARPVAARSSSIGGESAASDIVEQESSWSGRTVLVERDGVWPISAEGCRTGYFRSTDDGGYSGVAVDDWEVSVTTEGGPDLSDLVAATTPVPAPPPDDEALLVVPHTTYTTKVTNKGSEPRLSFVPRKTVGQGAVFDLREDVETTTPFRGREPLKDSYRVLARLHVLVTRASPDEYVFSAKVLSASAEFTGARKQSSRRLEWALFGAVGKTFEWTRPRANVFRFPTGVDPGLPSHFRCAGWLIPEFPAEKLGSGASWARLLEADAVPRGVGADPGLSGSAEIRSAGDGTWFQRESILVQAALENAPVPGTVRTESTVRRKLRPGEFFPDELEAIERTTTSVGPPGGRLEMRVEVKRTINATRVEVAVPPTRPAPPR